MYHVLQRELSQTFYLSNRKPPVEQRFWRILAYTLHMTSVLDVRWWGLPPPHLIFYMLAFSMYYFTPLYLLSQLVYTYLNFKKISLGQLQTIIFLFLLSSSAMVSNSQMIFIFYGCIDPLCYICLLYLAWFFFGVSNHLMV